MEISNRQRVLIQSNSLNRYIDLIPLRLQTTKINQQSSVQTKYSHLISSMKPIQNLISKYRQKINNFMKQLETKHRIKDIARQIELYSERANVMEELDKELDAKVEREKQVEEERKKRVKEIRNKLNSLKIENAKIAYEIEVEDMKLLASKKKEYQPVERVKLVPVETLEQKKLRQLEEEQQLLEKQFFSKVHEKIQMNTLMLQCFKEIRQTLKKTQKKCHQQGLAGSMLFKLTLPEKQNKPHGQYKMGNDFKSLVYNTLKGKYKEAIRKTKEQKIQVQAKKFNQFNQLQTIGILELKPESFNIIKYIVDLRTKDILLHYEQLK